MRIIDFEQLVTVRPEAWGGEVAVQVRACTVAEYNFGATLSLVPTSEQQAFLERHVRGIYAKLRPTDVRELHLAVMRASSLSEADLGNSEPRRSGAESTAGGTAPTVDDED